jgi:50S ribosomal subunit-associated GTPase HflX
VDRLSSEELASLAAERPEAVALSARRRQGLETLLERIEAALADRWVLRELDLAPSRSELLQEAYATAQVLSQTFVKGKIRLRMRVTPENWLRLTTRAGKP